MSQEAEILHCVNHPDRETLLRCNRCDKPICYRCAVQTPVGYRCKQCVTGQQAAYYNAGRFDLWIAAVIGVVLGGVLGVLGYTVLRAFGWFSFLGAFLIGPVAGGIIAEAIRRGVGRRRAPHLKPLAAAATVAGVFLGGFALYTAPALFLGASLSGAALSGAAALVFFRLDMLLLAALAASTIYARLL